MKKKVIITLIIVLTISLVILTNLNKDKDNIDDGINYKNITTTEAVTVLKEEADIILLDVRMKEEYDEQHIKNSILIPIDELESRVINEIVDKNAKIFVYCASGNRSRMASQILIDLGYTNVYNIGGISNEYELE